MRVQRWLLLSLSVCAGILLAGATVWLAWKLSATIWMFAVGFAVAYVSDPLLHWFERRGWSRARGVAVVAVGVLAILAALGFWLVPAVVGQGYDLVKAWPAYASGVQGMLARTNGWIAQEAPKLPHGQDLAAQIGPAMDKAWGWLQSKLPQALSVVLGAAVKSVSFAGWLLIVTVITVQFMLAIDVFRRAIISLMPTGTGPEVQALSRKVSVMLGRFVAGQATMCAVMGVLVTGLLTVVGMYYGTQYGLLIGVLAGVVYAVPWAGAFVTNVSATIIAYVTAQHDPVLAALVTLGGVTVCNFICDNILTPRVIGHKIGLHPLVLLFAILAGYQLMGIWGMILAAPIAGSIKIILARWLPIKEPEEGKAGGTLALDLPGAIRKVTAGAKGIAERIEDVIGGETHEHVSPDPKKDSKSHDDSGTA